MENGSLKSFTAPHESTYSLGLSLARTNRHGERRLRNKSSVRSTQVFATKALASEAIEALKLTINRQGFQRQAGPNTFSALIEHYRLKELPEDNHERKTKKTKKVYESNLKNHIVPRWGGYQLRDFLSVEIEE